MKLKDWEIPVRHAEIDWKAERERVDLAAVATNLLGPAPGRRGERGRRLWWPCPFHQDRNPSFAVDPGRAFWRCYGCNAHGDAADLIMRLEGLTFPEAIARLTGAAAPPSSAGGPAPRPATPPPPASPPSPSGLTAEAAVELVEASAARIWTEEGKEGLAYLTGPTRGLTPETIRRARLGWTPAVAVPTRDGDRCFRAAGVVIPWLAAGRLGLAKIRQPDGARPKYAEAFRDPAALTGIYPGPEAIRLGKPLVIVEGEFDALLLGQALGALASVVTLGSASAKPEPALLGRMLAAAPWYIAHDADEAGDRAAAEWAGYARARRVRPPLGKDWAEAAASPAGARGCGVDLARWWKDVLAGNLSPPLFTWPELARWRWGPALTDDAGPAQYAEEERLAIQEESGL